MDMFGMMNDMMENMVSDITLSLHDFYKQGSRYFLAFCSFCVYAKMSL